jgi:hypothetical protein
MSIKNDDNLQLYLPLNRDEQNITRFAYNYEDWRTLVGVSSISLKDSSVIFYVAGSSSYYNKIHYAGGYFTQSNINWTATWKLRIPSGTDGGICFHVQNSDNGYLLSIRTDLQIAAYLITSGVYSPLTITDINTSVRASATDYQEWTIKKIGINFYIYMNGSYMGTFSDSTFVSGYFGIRLNNCSMELEDFILISDTSTEYNILYGTGIGNCKGSFISSNKILNYDFYDTSGWRLNIGSGIISASNGELRVQSQTNTYGSGGEGWYAVNDVSLSGDFTFELDFKIAGVGQWWDQYPGFGLVADPINGYWGYRFNPWNGEFFRYDQTGYTL